MSTRVPVFLAAPARQHAEERLDVGVGAEVAVALKSLLPQGSRTSRAAGAVVAVAQALIRTQSNTSPSLEPILLRRPSPAR
jgi:hypothetical protein